MDYLDVARQRLARLRADDSPREISEICEKRPAESWSATLADGWLRMTLRHISGWHDLVLSCPVDGPEWQRHEDQVNEAYLEHDRRALRAALRRYEAFAFSAFLAAGLTGERLPAAVRTGAPHEDRRQPIREGGTNESARA